MRAFLAIDLNKEIKDEIIKIQQELKKYVKGKFVEPENLHLTLEFLGEIDENKADELKNGLKSIKFEKFSSSLGKIGFFPNENFINVVWISLENNKIKELHNKINELLKIRNEKFESHITIARVKSIENKKEFLKKISELKIKKIIFEINDFVLKKSTLTEKGPIYEDIYRLELV